MDKKGKADFSLAFFVLYFPLLLIRSFIRIRSFVFVSWSLLKKLTRTAAYGVYISQLVRYARICTSKVDFINRLRRLSLRLRQQGFETNLLQILQSLWSYRREVWCSPAGDEMSNPGLNCKSLHHLLQ